MKVAICGDIHWSKTSSIVNKKLNKYTVRLNSLINSVNWFENLSKEKECDCEVFLGDFFNKPVLDDKEITALNELKWNDKLRYFLVGNHESSVENLSYSSTNILEPFGNVINEVSVITDDSCDFSFYFLPYMLDRDRITVESVTKDDNKKKIVFSHNDIAGIQYGVIQSKTGFDIKDITNNSDLYINGHIHNGSWVNNKILNLGVLTGQNFTQDAFAYKHQVAILDTDTLQVELYENPYALNFYKIEIEKAEDVNKLYNLKNNAVVYVQSKEELLSNVIQAFEDNKNIVAHKKQIISEIVNGDKVDENLKELKIDHVKEFYNFELENLDNTEVLIEELNEICK